MNLETLESNLQALITNLDKDTFIYDLLLAYDLPKASVTRLHKGDYNLSKVQGEILWKKKLFFKQDTNTDLHHLIDQLSADSTIAKQHPRFIIVTDFKSLLSVDTKTGDTLDILITDLAKHYDFFLPWAGLEKAQYQSENPADVKAAERMGRLYDIILEDNPTEDKDQIHALNIFLSRLLFCFFAEDTGIFEDNQFTNAIASHTADDGSDLHTYLLKLFAVLNLQGRSDYPHYLQDFPYVNGGLFADEYPIPTFSIKSRKIIVECGTLNWKAINPDIFGSMIQAVVHNDQRSNMGMHYTSVVNIMKVIEPLFLNDLKEALEKAEGKEKQLIKLLGRLYNLRIFDPACGSGNFLIIAYKELCQLEIEIFKQLQEIDASNWNHAVSGLHLNQFYGIELDDFAHETAKLSLWLTEHQMNLAFKIVFGEARPTLPLQDSGNITCGNATRLDWKVICPKTDIKGKTRYEIYVLGNPPYLGSSMQSKEQKKDMAHVHTEVNGYKNLDYISCWFHLGAKYIKNINAQLAFVSTNSICQGQQVELMWPYILNHNLEINFAHQSFKWINNAKGNAGVTCIIVGIGNFSTNPKYIYKLGVRHLAKNINTKLLDGKNISIKKQSKPLSLLPIMENGNKAVDGGNLIFATDEDKNYFINNNYLSEKFIKKLIGSKEFIRGLTRWCLWIEDNDATEALRINGIQSRVNLVIESILASTDSGANKLSSTAYRFRDQRMPLEQSLFIPSVSSERREYIPLGFLDKESVIVAPNFAIFDPPTYVFATISSKMHMTWVRTTAGRLKTDYRYSSALCYNTFPFPEITDSQKITLEDHVFKVLDERELHPEKTMAQLYDPDKMPEGLRQAHHEMDLAIEQCYRSKPFKSDEERLEYLFTLYEEMIAAEAK